MVKPGSEPPSLPQGQGLRYLYERLSESEFQRLCGDLLAHLHPDATIFPVGQKDGGRDITSKATKLLIFQVKWTSHALQNPVTWLDKAIRSEAINIRRLVAAGAKDYRIITSVAGTAAPIQGTMDRLEAVLNRYSSEFEIPMSCWWRSDLDARVAAAPDAIKWAHPEMLAGVEAFRYLMASEGALADGDHQLRGLLRRLLATQWREDAKVKFKQVEMDAHDLDRLFVDVEATQVAITSRARRVSPINDDPLGGAAAYLLSMKQGCTVVRGEPGQGKSTLAQFVCQVHRARLLPDSFPRSSFQTDVEPSEPRFPIRVDLQDYGAWLRGADPFARDDPTQQRPLRAGRKRGEVERFLIELFRAGSGGMTVTADTLRGILDRFPLLIVFDGLDEVAHEETRGRVVDEINAFTARLFTGLLSAQVVVTTRPNASQLPEPDGDVFETIALSRLTQGLRIAYLRKWADVNDVRGKDRRDLERTFRQRIVEPHILQLAGNPMQLTILLYLMHRRGMSVPAARTELYTSYMEIFLDREIERTPEIAPYRDDLQEVVSFLGWHLQSRAEATHLPHLSVREIRKAILDYLFYVDKDTELVDVLFTAATQKVWVLSSKVQGTFEFDVQSMREYFAARFLSLYAGAELRDFDESNVLRHLLRNPYWQNTSRFLAGFSKPNELASLVEMLEDEFRTRVRPRQVRMAAWRLVTDGVFDARQRTQQRVLRLFTADPLSLRYLSEDASGSELASPANERGRNDFVALLRSDIEQEPDSALAFDRATLLLRVQSQPLFTEWWSSAFQNAADPDRSAWLDIAACAQAGRWLRAEDLQDLSLSETQAELAVRAGIDPEPGSALETQMTKSVLDGLCSDVIPRADSFPGALLAVAGPREHLTRASTDGAGRAERLIYEIEVGHLAKPMTAQQRRRALVRLKQRDPRLSRLREAGRFGRGQLGTTSPWSNSARVLADGFGPCWLAAEATVIGAALDSDKFKVGGDLTRDSSPFGPEADYGRLLQEIRFNHTKSEWWAQQFEATSADIDRATWALALVATADEEVLEINLDRLGSVVADCSVSQSKALFGSSSRIGAAFVGRRLPKRLLPSAISVSPDVGLLIAHHIGGNDILMWSVTRRVELSKFSDEQLGDLARHGIAAWPALRVLSMRVLERPSLEVLNQLRRFGSASVCPALPRWEAPQSCVNAVLDEPEMYPLPWIDAAEAANSLAVHTDAVGKIAHEERWFGSTT